MAADKIGVEDLGMNTGALIDCAGRVGVASVVGGDCGGALSDGDGRFYKFSGSLYGKSGGGGT